MLKKMLFISAIVGISSLAIAQKPVKGDKGFTFGVTGINVISVNTAPSSTGTLLFKYHFADDMAARAGIIFGRTGTTDVDNDTAVTGVKTTTKEAKNNWAISLGAQKAFGSGTKLVPYLGFDILVGGNSGNKDVKEEVVVVKGGVGSVGDSKDTKTTYASGFNFGFVPVVGFDYFFTDHFAFGTEFGYGFRYSSTGEETSTITTTGTTTGKYGPSDTKNGTKGKTNSGTTLGTNGSACISVSVYF